MSTSNAHVSVDGKCRTDDAPGDLAPSHYSDTLAPVFAPKKGWVTGIPAGKSWRLCSYHMERKKSQIEERINAFRQAAYGLPGTWSGRRQEAQQTAKIRPRQYRAIQQRRRTTRRRTGHVPLPPPQSSHGHTPGLIIDYPPSPLYISPALSRSSSPSSGACEECPEEHPEDSPISQREELEWGFWQQIRRQAYTGRTMFGQTAGSGTQMGGQELQRSPSPSRSQSPPLTIRHLAIRTRR
ncbi:hypothetical protein QC762_301220 [Podospora pseudocomata]|uniref:Uncharacterized protein n=1 Tax=Podospora pseudocomata TaxID=2093779 RepID=A0ABR0GHQ6_9PEZI|nr:hypothetical protein QC762_301220 [Podospora pseudocomata]